MKRRKFLTAGSSLLMAAGFEPARLLAGDANTLDVRTVGFASGLSKAKFEALLNQTFYIRTADNALVTAVLTKVSGSTPPGNPEQFSVFFSGLGPSSLPAGTHTVEHYVAGQTALYLEPVPADWTAPRYRADFCLLR